MERHKKSEDSSENNSPNSFLEFLEKEHLESERIKKENINKLTKEEYSSIIEDYLTNRDLHLADTLEFVKNFVARKTNGEYVQKYSIQQLIMRIANDLDIKSYLFNHKNLPF